MASYRKIAKCPKCLPDVKGAIFHKVMGENGWQWECQNCHYTCVARTNKVTPKITPSQESVIAKLRQFGWTLEISFIGRKVWVSGNKDRGSSMRNLFDGDSIYGTIGPCGSFEIKLQRFGGDKVLTDNIDLHVYLA